MFHGCRPQTVGKQSTKEPEGMGDLGTIAAELPFLILEVREGRPLIVLNQLYLLWILMDES